nr:hypothetical protein [Tanacetum cinerariifolium]
SSHRSSHVTIQPIQGRQNFVSAGSSRPFTSGQGGAPGKQRVITCYNCKGKAKIALMANLSHYGSDNVAEFSTLTHSNTEIESDSNIIPYSQYLNETQSNTVQNSTLSALQDDLILNMIEQLKTQVVTCTKINQDNKQTQVVTFTKINQDNKQVNDLLTAELERYKHQEGVLNELKHDEKASTSYEHSQEIDSLKHTLSEYLKEKESFKKKISILKDDLQKEESRNIDRELALEKEALGFQNPRYLKKAQQLKPNLYDGSVIGKSDGIVVPDSENTLMHAEESRSKMIEKQNDPQLIEKKTESYAEQAFWSQYSVQTDEPTHSGTTIVEVPKELPKVSMELPKVSMVNSCLKRLKFYLASFDIVVKERTTATAITEGTWGFEHTKACFRDDIIPFVKNLKDLFTSFDQYLIDEVSEVQKIFKQMEMAVEQNYAAKSEFQSKMETVLKENDLILKHALGVDIVNIVRDNVSSSESAPNFADLFEINELKAQIQEKDTVILKLKEKIKSLRADDKESKVEDIETQNLELDHRVTKLTAETIIRNRLTNNFLTQLSLRVFTQKNSVMT